MLIKNKCFLIALMIFLWFVALSTYADDDLEEKIYITESDGKLNALINGGDTATTRLRVREHVLWKASSGYLGAVLTNDHFYVISTTAGQWREHRLKSEEAEGALVSLSPNIALLATTDRAICYNISTNSFFETRLTVREKLVAAKAGSYVAVVVTTDKVFGIRKSNSSFNIVRLGIGEEVEDVQVTDSRVVVRTSARLLSFVADDSEWEEKKL